MSTPTRILVVEDEAEQRQLVSRVLDRAGYLVSEADSAEGALEILETVPVDVVLSDWKLPGADGMELLARTRESHPQVAFIMVTAYGSISRAVEAIRTGAHDYLTKPFERQALLLAVERTLRARRLEDENRRLTAALEERDRLVELIGRAPAMQTVFRRVEKIADTVATVLITGESGTGKELAARALHGLSARASGPFVTVNCAAIPEGLMETEFFGAEKGAYTGAHATRPGQWEMAHRGTLFLDEVGELPLAIQPKLLRALQDGKVTRVGGTRVTDTDVRLVAATNRDLQAEVESGGFRQDLYYRLNVVPVELPPLRERLEDIPLLVEHFAERTARRHGLQVQAFPPQVLRQLMSYPWPGNVRELANLVERLILLAEDGEITLQDLPGEMTGKARVGGGFRLPATGLSWDAHEGELLSQALELAQGNRARAARLLDLPYKAFLYRLEKHNLS